jgi:hypothetical protein
MAKRRKEKDEEEEKPFKLPKFDEVAFLKREKRNIKATFISFLFGCFMALICFGFWALMGRENGLRWELVLLVAVIDAAFLKYIFVRLNIDLTDFARKNWFGSYATYFFTWLIVFVVLVNPPFYDDEDPRMEVVVLPEMQEPGGTILIVAKITDNSGIEKQDIAFTIDNNPILISDFDFNDNIFIYTYVGPDNITGEETHTYSLTVKDNGGNTNENKGSFSFSKDTIYLALPNPGDLVKAASDIKFGVKTNVLRVYYTVSNGNEINATQQADRKDFYITSPEYEGWSPGENKTVNVSAEVIYNFENDFLKDEKGNLVLNKNNNAISRWFVNYINDTDTYRFEVADESSIGKEPVKAIARPKPRTVSAPGFEILVFLISLVVVILIFKYQNKDRRNQK